MSQEPKEVTSIIDLSKGMEAGTDPKLSEKPILIQNMYPDHDGSLKPRGGSATMDTNEIDNPNIFSHNGKLYTAGDHLRVSTGLAAAESVGELHLFDIETEELNVDENDIYAVEMAQNSTYRIIGYSYFNQTTFKAYRRSDGRLMDTFVPPTGGGTHAVCKVVSSAGRLCFFFKNGSAMIKWGYFDEYLGRFTTYYNVTGSTAYSTHLLFAVYVGSTNVMLCAASSAVTTEMICLNTSTGVTVGAYLVGGLTQPMGLIQFVDPYNNYSAVVVTWDTGTYGVVAQGYNSAGLKISFQILWTPIGNQRPRVACGVQRDDYTLSIYWSFYNNLAPVSGGLKSTETKRRDYITTWGGTPAPSSMGTSYACVNGCTPSQDPFFAGPGTRMYLPITVNTASTLDVAPLNNFLWSGDTNLLSYTYKPLRGKYLAGRAWHGDGGIGTPREVSRVSSDGDVRQFATVYLKNPNSLAKGAKLVTVTPSDTFKPVLSEQGIRIPSSLPYYSDGQEIVEDSWPMIPPAPSATVGAGAGSQAAGTYYYRVMWKGTDSDGRVFKSAMSNATKVVNPGARQVAVDVNNCVVTNRQNVQWELYRTEANGGVWKFLGGGTVKGRVYNLAYNYNDIKADSALGAAIYTTGGVLDDDPPDSHRVATLHHGRYCYAPFDRESSVVRYGKQSGPTDPLNHSAYLEVPVDMDGGRITALASYQGRLVIFKERRVFVATGVEKDNTGLGYGYRPAELLSGSVGCDDQNTVVATDAGLFFKGTNGLIYRITPKFVVDRTVGERVRYYTVDSGSITSASLWEDAGAVVFQTDEVTLLYFWEFDCWTLWTWSGVSTAFFDPGLTDGALLYWHDGIRVNYWSPSLNVDFDTWPVVCAVDTGWQSPGGPLANFIPTRTLWLGQRNALLNTLHLQFAYNFDTTWVDNEALIWNMATANPDEEHYTMPGGSRDGAALFDSTPSERAVTSIRAKLYFAMTGASVSLSAVVIGFLPESALYRPGPDRTFEKEV